MIKNMDAYRDHQKGYGHPLIIIMSRKVRKEAKPHGQNLPQDRKRHKIWNMSSTYIHLHFNELTELFLDEGHAEEITNSMIMRWSVEPARGKRRDSLYLINWWSRRIIWMIISSVKILSTNIIWNGKYIYSYSFPKSTKIKSIYFTPNSLNSCKIVMWITCQSSNLM